MRYRTSSSTITKQVGNSLLGKAIPRMLFPVCTNQTCSMEIEQLSALIWIYFEVQVKDPSCLSPSLHGTLLLRSTGLSFAWLNIEYLQKISVDCQSYGNHLCLQSFPTRRIMFNYYYDFLYVPIDTNRMNSGSTSSITLNNQESSIYSYEFIVDDRNLGGTIHIDLESRVMVE